MTIFHTTPMPLFARSICTLSLIFLFSGSYAADSELIAMPTGRLDQDGTWRNDFSFVKPYPTFRTQATILPWLQGGLGIVRVMGVDGFPNSLGNDYTDFKKSYGDYKDKTLFGRIKLTDETKQIPATALIVQDPIGTSLFKSTAVAASKRFIVNNIPVDTTVGYGTGRIKGIFGGIKATVPSVSGLKIMIEKDANHYLSDRFAQETGLNKLSRSQRTINYGVEYTPDNSAWSMRLARRMGTTEIQVQHTVDNNIRDTSPKNNEKPRFRIPLKQPTAAQWNSNSAHLEAMRQVLHSYGFKNIRIKYTASNRLQLTLSHVTQLYASSAVGDAVHIALKTTPQETKSIAVIYINDETNLATSEYLFTDLAALNSYLEGQSSQQNLLASFKLNAPTPHSIDAVATSVEQSLPFNAADKIAVLGGYTLPQLGLTARRENPSFQITPLGLTWDSGGEKRYRAGFSPKISSYLNGPGGLQYAVKAEAQLEAKLNKNTYANVIFNKTLTENISKLGIGASNSTQHKVRSRSAFYEIGKQAKLDLAVINHFNHLGKNLYGRVNAGIFERAYVGIGGQVLYAPTQSPWAVDLSIDTVAQRDEQTMFGLNGYRTTTALAALHYRLPMETNLTLRAGRFLAKDVGVRMEFKRRFWGGTELGAWMSVTNAKDYGVGTSNYRDKGLLISLPFDGMLPNYSRQKASIALSPWTRDIAQMVSNPADLYSLLEEDWRNNRVQNGLERFAGVADYDGQVHLGALAINDGIIPPINNAVRSFQQGIQHVNWRNMLATGAVFTALTASSDRAMNRNVVHLLKNSAMQRRFKQVDDISSGLTFLGVGASALWAYDGSNYARSHVALASLESSAAAVLAATSLKYLTNRARPSSGLSNTSFGTKNRGDSSFPSRHMAMATALVTPYALHYDAPILYTLPLLTAVGRMGTRQHWFSDVAVGGAMGYALGNLFYNAHTTQMGKQRSPILFNATTNALSITIPTK
jgi:membrane-associated phospholipid phosphatase/LysM repeat protein